MGWAVTIIKWLAVVVFAVIGIGFILSGTGIDAVALDHGVWGADAIAAASAQIHALGLARYALWIGTCSIVLSLLIATVFRTQ